MAQKHEDDPRAVRVTIDLVITKYSDEHVQTEAALEGEIHSWFSDLGCGVQSVQVEAIPLDVPAYRAEVKAFVDAELAKFGLKPVE